MTPDLIVQITACTAGFNAAMNRAVDSTARFARALNTRADPHYPRPLAIDGHAHNSRQRRRTRSKRRR